jgi:hypothetical protein
MTSMPVALTARAAAGPEGALWVAHIDRRGDVVMVLAIDEGTRCVDELFLRHLVDVVDRVGLPAAMLAVSRADGRPQRVDRRLRRDLDQRLRDSATELLGMWAVGESEARLISAAGAKPVDGGAADDRPHRSRRPQRPRTRGHE